MRRLAPLFVIMSLVFLPVTTLAGGDNAPAAATAEEVLDEMTVEERIGQLFLVTFEGSSIEEGSPIERLIRQHHISGVVLRQENDNFVGAPNTALGVRQLSESLQLIEYNGSLEDSIRDPETDEQIAPTYVPLFVAVNDQEAGNAIPQFIDGLSSFPSQMALGAAWQPDLARQTGLGMGQELSSMGINMYLGPSLDVLEEPVQSGPGDLGTRAFGGDPFWVSEMGNAYVAGLHEGSDGKMAIIPKHFPGHGGSDRPLQEEVATVRKSIDQLLQIELPPFFSVTSDAPGADPSIADGLLISHIRYQGFQGNIRATTRPISLDPEAYSQLMALEPIQAWRQLGGVTVSDSLGSRAIRRFRDPLEQTFQPQLVSRDALVAGNDLLYLGNIQAPEDPDEATTIEGVLAFFAQKYREDPVFAQRVDEAATRVLALKLRLYDGTFVRSRVVPPMSAMDVLGSNRDVTIDVIRAGASLISPDPEQVDDRLGGVPDLRDRVVFFTDVNSLNRCQDCPTELSIPVDSLERRVNDLYGAGASGQVGTWNLWSFTTADLANFLGQPPDTEDVVIPLTSPEEVDEPLRTADWIIFSISDLHNSSPGATTLQLLLDERPDLIRDKRLVVFSFDVPYGLDATDLSKIDVFYALYTASDPAVDIAARLLFQELTAPGASPVSVPGIGYDLIEALKPDPQQLISLSIEPVLGDGTPTPDAETGFTQGSIIRIATELILDSNGHPVPDDTPVEFVILQQPEGIRQTVEAVTRQGAAEITFRLDRLGLFVIEARSDPALRSDVLQLNVQEGVPAFPTVIAPTPIPTLTEQPTQTPGSITQTPAESDEADNEPADAAATAAEAVGFSTLILGLLGVGVVVGGSYYYVGRSDRWLGTQLRCALVAAVGGLVGYNYLALSLPGSDSLMMLLGNWSGLLLAILGGILALSIYAGYIAVTSDQ